MKPKDKRKPETIIAELQQQIRNSVAMIPECGCWVWLGELSSGGYGPYARAYTAFTGKIRPRRPLDLDYKCRIRSCINPDHLEVVTHKENILRGAGYAAKNAKKTECPKCGGSFSVVPINGKRFCRPCRRKLQDAWRERSPKHYQKRGYTNSRELYT